jgi:UDP-N-acetylmuramyl pentapeptide synthase
MRLMVKNGTNNTTIVDDSYSSDFQSLKIALDFLESQTKYKNNVRNMMRFVTAMEDKDKNKIPDTEILDTFI